jgi:hypothetical protein
MEYQHQFLFHELETELAPPTDAAESKSADKNDNMEE